MRILAIADVPCKALWDYFDQARLEGIDLILSAGDLPAAYLSFLVTFAHCPVIYVPGNHDDRYTQKPPEGCICVDDSIYVYEGVRILGLGGSMRYKPGTYQYTESEMKRRAGKLRFKIMRSRGFDILLTHAPVQGFDDQEDLPHHGFETFGTMLEKYHPSVMVHGHVHMNYGMNIPRESVHPSGTRIINAYERYVFEI